jgi:hypothetical protein
MYYIYLYQTTQEIQTEFTSESYEEIIKLWEYATDLEDEYTEIDDELVLYKDDEVVHYYKITDEQRE